MYRSKIPFRTRRRTVWKSKRAPMNTGEEILPIKYDVRNKFPERRLVGPDTPSL